MEPFKNAIQSGAIWKWYFLKTVFSSVDGENDLRSFISISNKPLDK